MGIIKIKKGLNLPINGEPEQIIAEKKDVKQVALLGIDYIDMKPLFMVVVGDRVKLGQLLFVDRKMPFIKYISPGCGKVVAINRGVKRAFVSIVIELDGNDEITFQSYKKDQLKTLDRQKVVSQLVESGLWTSLRTRPFSKIANPESEPHSIFITAIDTNPLAPSIEKILECHEDSFLNGLEILSKLTKGKIFLCKAPDIRIPNAKIDRISVEEFDGPHPGGNAGTHIHFLDPVHRNKTVWYINVQDVIAVGILFTTGRLHVERIISLAGPGVKKPRLIRTRMGASIDNLTFGELKEGNTRIISGSIFSGHTAEDATSFLGKYHQQITVLPENRTRTFLSWFRPGFNLYSVQNIVASRFLSNKKFNFTTDTRGSLRAIVPNSSYNKIMPLDLLPAYLLRSLAVDDVDEAESLGCLELDEEDLALCTFVCPSKINHGENLRRALTIIEKEG